jgi:hypothetical protein
MLQLFRIAAQMLLSAAGGWAASDMFNESERTKQIQAGKTPTQDTTTSGSFFSWLQGLLGVPRWILWVLVLLGAAFAIKKFFNKR